MITIKTENDIEILREGGRRLAHIVDKILGKISPGISTEDLDIFARNLIEKEGDIPAFLNYRPVGVSRAYPKSICISINDEIVHGIPSQKRFIMEGDIVSVDVGLNHKGLFTDHARTCAIGKLDKRGKDLIRITDEALSVGIKAVSPGAHVGDIGHAIENFIAPYQFGIVKELSGHGVGYKIHEDPYIPNYGKVGTGVMLKPGMVIAIEPMLTEGSPKISFSSDGYTITTRDCLRAAHFEHTILVTDRGAEILTKL